MSDTTSYYMACCEAASLLTDGADPEYRRGIVEVIGFAFGRTADDLEQVEADIDNLIPGGCVFCDTTKGAFWVGKDGKKVCQSKDACIARIKARPPLVPLDGTQGPAYVREGS